MLPCIGGLKGSPHFFGKAEGTTGGSLLGCRDYCRFVFFWSFLACACSRILLLFGSGDASWYLAGTHSQVHEACLTGGKRHLLSGVALMRKLLVSVMVMQPFSMGDSCIPSRNHGSCCSGEKS